jgi:hypothetical protein
MLRPDVEHARDALGRYPGGARQRQTRELRVLTLPTRCALKVSMQVLTISQGSGSTHRKQRSRRLANSITTPLSPAAALLDDSTAEQRLAVCRGRLVRTRGLPPIKRLASRSARDAICDRAGWASQEHFFVGAPRSRHAKIG